MSLSLHANMFLNTLLYLDNNNHSILYFFLSLKKKYLEFMYLRLIVCTHHTNIYIYILYSIYIVHL